jgi:hypothetical protein
MPAVRWLSMRLLILLAYILLPEPLMGQTPTEHAGFWSWFQANEASLARVTTGNEPVCDALLERLKRVDSALTFEFGPVQAKPREFTISADGLASGFPAVLALVRAAPPLPRWSVIPFRRPHPGFTRVRFENISLDAAQVEFIAEPDEDKTGLTLSVPGFRETPKKKYEHAAYLLLDGMIGEYPMETRVGFIDVGGHATRRAGPWRPLTALATVIDTTVP